MENDFKRADEESWLQWKLQDGYEFGPRNVGVTLIEQTLGPKSQTQDTQGQGANIVHSTACLSFCNF
jgi:hypothetical protein